MRGQRAGTDRTISPSASSRESTRRAAGNAAVTGPPGPASSRRAGGGIPAESGPVLPFAPSVTTAPPPARAAAGRWRRPVPPRGARRRAAAPVCRLRSARPAVLPAAGHGSRRRCRAQHRHVARRVVPVLTRVAVGRSQAVAPVPAAQGRHRNVQNLGHRADGEPDRRIVCRIGFAHRCTHLSRAGQPAVPPLGCRPVPGPRLPSPSRGRSRNSARDAHASRLMMRNRFTSYWVAGARSDRRQPVDPARELLVVSPPIFTR